MIRFLIRLFQSPRIIKYKLLSSNKNITGSPVYNQPILMDGAGKIVFEENIEIGVRKSDSFYSGYSFLMAKSKDSKITFGAGSRINNNFVIICSREVYVGAKCLIGSNVKIYDSDFHSLIPDQRFGGAPQTAAVIIEENVFIGSDVIILKGVRIGKNSVIGSGSVVTKDVPQNSIAAGNPARTLRQI